MKTEKIYRRISRTAYQKKLPPQYSGSFWEGYVYVSDGDRFFKMKPDNLPENVYNPIESNYIEHTINSMYDCKARNLTPLPDINTIKDIINSKDLKRENRYRMKVGKKYIDIFYLLDALEAISDPICKESKDYIRIENEQNELCIIKE